MKGKNLKNKQKGITLIALVVTIVVLLILAGVSISLVLGNNGLISKAKDARNAYEQGAVNDETGMNNLYDEIASILGENPGETGGNGEGSGGTGGGSGGGEGTGTTVDGVTIPTGFYYVGGTSASGLVISDNSADENKYQGQITVGTDLQGNQFVWIPVTYSNFHLIEGYYNSSLHTLLSATTNPSREAGSTVAAGTPLSKNSTAGTAESIAMYKSVQDNGGFYIARYEAGIISENDENGKPKDNYSLATKTVTDGKVKPLSKAGVGVWNSIAWGGTRSNTASDGLPGDDTANGAVKVARNMYTKSETCGVTSTLCYGVQWDAVMQFIDSNYVTGTCANDSFVKNSTSKGNYSGSISTTGYYAEKNIYDLAGNVVEWTMEAFGSDSRVGRGGRYDGSGSVSPASRRFNNLPDYSINFIGFRVALYL